MAPGEPYPYVRIVLNILVSLTLFTALFLGIFWTPGLLLGLFAAAYAADANAFSQTVDRARRLRSVGAAARLRRGGWLDSAATRH